MLTAKVNIDYTVLVSEELRALARSTGWRNERVTGDHCAKVDNAAQADALQWDKQPFRAETTSSTLPAFPEIRLRRDGARPFRFHGMLLFSEEIKGHAGGIGDGYAATGNQSLSIFLSSEGTCVAQFASEPPSNLPARPVYLVGEVKDPNDVLSLLDQCEPAMMYIGISPEERSDACLDLEAIQNLREQNRQLTKTVTHHLKNLS